MRIRFLLLLLSGLLAVNYSCKNAAPETTFGGPVDDQKVMPVAEAKGLLQSSPEVETTLKGKVKEVCQAEGCWFNLDQGDGSALLVRMPEHAFTVPKDLSGKTVMVAGRLHYDTTDVATLRDYARDAGKSQAEIDAITEPSVELVLEASGVEIR
jgi:hypothetical protein